MKRLESGRRELPAVDALNAREAVDRFLESRNLIQPPAFRSTLFASGRLHVQGDGGCGIDGNEVARRSLAPVRCHCCGCDQRRVAGTDLQHLLRSLLAQQRIEHLGIPALVELVPNVNPTPPDIALEFFDVLDEVFLDERKL